MDGKIVGAGDDEQLDSEGEIDYNKKENKTSEQGEVIDGQEKGKEDRRTRANSLFVWGGNREWRDVAFSDDGGTIRLLSSVIGEKETLQRINHSQKR